MERRFRLGSEIVDFNAESAPTLTYSEDQTRMILSFPIISEPRPATENPEATNPRRHTYRDVFELTGGSAFGTELTASLSSIGQNANG